MSGSEQKITPRALQNARMSASRTEIVNYYEALFHTAGLTEQTYRNPATAADFLFASRPDEVIEIHLTDRPDTPGIDGVVVTVNYASK